MGTKAGLWLWPAIACLVTLGAALALRALLLVVARRVAPAGGGVRAVAAGAKLPSLLWCVVAGLYAAVELAELPARLAAQLGRALEAAIVLSVTFTLAGVLGTAIAHASERRALGGPVTGLARTVARAAVIVVGVLVLLPTLGVQITPILTALGVGGLAVALALQETLSNLFAGIHLLADKPIRVGDWVRIADGVEGRVLDVGWRSTRVATILNTVVVVPNATVARSTIVNYDLPEPRTLLMIPVSVGQGSDPALVESALVDETRRAAADIAGLLAEPAPLVRFMPGFGQHSLDFTLVCHLVSMADQYEVQSELRKRVLARLRREGVELAVPVRVVQLAPGRAAPDTGPPPA